MLKETQSTEITQWFHNVLIQPFLWE